MPFTVTSGLAPETGAPLTAAGIPTGTQVTGKVGSGGIIVTPVMTADTVIGSTAIDVQSTTGIAAGQAVNRGDGEAVVVNTVVGNTVNLSGAITTDFKGNLVTYSDVSGTNVTSLGNGLRLDISRASGSYTLDAISHSGNDYQVGDQLIIAGDNLGGTSPANDCDITVDSVDTGGEVLSLTLSGTAFNGTGNFSAVANTYNHGNGNLSLIHI